MAGLHLAGAQFRGGIRASAAKFTHCVLSGATLEAGRNGVACDMINAIIEHDIDLNAGLLNKTEVEPADIKGAFILENAQVGGRLRLDGVCFEAKPEHPDCLSLSRAHIESSLEIRNLKGPRGGRFDLSDAQISAIDDDPGNRLACARPA